MAAALVFALGVMSVVAGTAQRRVTLTVHRVAQTDNLDRDVLIKDRADFYALVWIDDQEFKTKNFSDDDGRPYWTITGHTEKSIVPIRIRLMDDDGGLERGDDHVDINPVSGEKDLMFWYNLDTHQVWGDVSGRAKQMLMSFGEGDNDRGRIWFTIE